MREAVQGEAAVDLGAARSERPTTALPLAQLVQLSIYWFGISSIWGALDGVILQARMPALVGEHDTGLALAGAKIAAVAIAIIVQPTVGSISDYTVSRWGRRKPFIAIGATLDVVFLIGLATSSTFVTVLAFLLLLQFSSNFAQGPFQGYLPDLVPASQVGMASALVGVMSVLGTIGGQAIAYTGFLMGRDFTLPTIGVGLIELSTAIGTILWVREGRAPNDRGGRPWRTIALEAWGTDILRERSYLWLVGSRLFILAGVGVIYNLSVLYMERSLGLNDQEKSLWGTIASVAIGASILVAAIPAARLAERIGRKAVIYLACASGAAGMAVLVVAPSIGVAMVGIVLVALGAGSFLSVDWALMTDIIPKAEAGRFMGLSNVATASAGPVALIVGGPLVTFLAGGAGPRAAMAAGILFFAAGALLLRPVDPSRREDVPDASAAEQPGPPPTPMPLPADGGS
jgi:MFS-type transporter involved in bile tolerance (Atg22 family)